MFTYRSTYIEILTISDVPHGTGLGSSGSFTTALLRALHAFYHETVEPTELAEAACQIELNRLREPIGKQDQYVAAFGGIRAFTFAHDGVVSSEPLRLDAEMRSTLEKSIQLFFTGIRRSASDILRDQFARLERRERALVDNLHFEMENARQSRVALEKGDLAGYGRLLSDHWNMKRKRSSAISNPQIDRWYEMGLNNGAYGGKVVGAGGGGFLMFCSRDSEALTRCMRGEGLTELRFGFENRGSHVLLQ
jgi:D-glycero-alpha-D-manno-heptose-7-phosphate kinase